MAIGRQFVLRTHHALNIDSSFTLANYSCDDLITHLRKNDMLITSRNYMSQKLQLIDLIESIEWIVFRVRNCKFEKKTFSTIVLHVNLQLPLT